ncbi:hypothetical protein ACH5RR_015913 [Cinchona calisaya]|uniref:Large ribosomal subunit protein bL12 C-terminal domain-containing protein n=1 Tax=Cinchona calisaya TaxID=153742 RepID=A0ABD2ZUI3_9GENT
MAMGDHHQCYSSSESCRDIERNYPLPYLVCHLFVALVAWIVEIYVVTILIQCVKDYDGVFERSIFIGFTIVAIAFVVIGFVMLVYCCCSTLSKIFGWELKSCHCYPERDIEKGESEAFIMPGGCQFQCMKTIHKLSNESYPSERVGRLVEEIAGLTNDEVAELSSILVKKMAMKEHPFVGVTKPGVSGLAGLAMEVPIAVKGEKKVEKAIFDLELESYSSSYPSLVKIVKEIRELTDLGWWETVNLMEKAPALLKKGVSREEGEQIIQKMKAIGAKVVMN